MRRLTFAPAAEADLLEILDFIAADAPDVALALAADLEQRCETLLTFPFRGRSREEIARNLRSVSHRRYVIFYTPGTEEVRIERILHSARDVADLFDTGG